MFIKTSVAVLALATFARAQQPTQASDDLGTILQTASKKVLETCSSWPPRYATSQHDQASKDVRKLPDATAVLTAQLASSLLIDPTIKPMVYQGSFLRLLDSVGTFDPDVANNALLKLALTSSPNDLSLWGKDLASVKHDCTSMLGLIAKGGSNYAIPLISLNAAFNANQTTSSNQTSTFIYGTFQSPFEALYHSDSQAKRLFASFRALSWRLRSNESAPDKYVAVTRLLSIDKTYITAEDSSFLGKIKAGVQISIAEASGGVSGQLATSLQTNSKSYITYFWKQQIHELPTIDSLVTSISTALPQFAIDTNQLTTSNPVHATATVTGWPEDMCTATEWNFRVSDRALQPNGFTMKPGASVDGLPTCAIEAAFSLLPGVTQSASTTNPQLMLESKTNTSASIPLQVSGALFVPGKPTWSLEVVPAKWNVLLDPSGTKSSIQWIIRGHIDLPAAGGRVLKSISISAANSRCKSADNSSLPVHEIKMEGAADGVTKVGPDPTFVLDAFLSLLTVPPYNDDVAQPNKRICSIYGTLKVSTTEPSGGSTQTDSLEFHTSPIFYPNEQPSVPVVPTGLSAVGSPSQIALSWNPVAGASSYSVYRGTVSGNEILIKAGINTTTFTDTGLIQGTKYFYAVTALNSAGESQRSPEANASPQ